ncbi:NADH:ubiquinone reductase (Na(+)-transporting) subunit B [Prosthecochloris sp. N3]|uniref:Na(+)-translocating NADH-quinone reductase subunit B n=1 Tax=Prosthecochloris ethylica TaxID=2743976 RepID=A0ABR9XTW8_9CHLB|nr:MULTISPECIES: NADH:ubiquinone reductase (Na(+)-transporting) subunit B [Prosthecochloris]MBF0587240.1 NADH:ubiquinone reductase (Na(+)-transporting) subunit B [Prosthecochloris ethylica]MBF0637313.1 NADH:ubiquinone reductase (Na(+)-transporting) subunit B [Prosthecochloris ethylica]NUK48402.1 NADH:ubiquinone reductase (Na(+)-transporting) subunit B [Prosthecochloris ethylica]RNA65914.1 NADH:ubiquinone reductase (Na(+)-transporting) subunit B [Prosthecochloris sp. ZM_2]
MNSFRKLLDRVEPRFREGGRWSRYWPLYEMVDTMFYVPATTAPGPPHVRDAVDMKRSMVTVILALLPALLFGIYNTGYQAAPGEHPFWQLQTGIGAVLPLVLVSYIVGGIWELLFAVTRRHEINEGFLVTGLLLPLTLPPDIPLWMVAAGISFGVVIGKEVTGGTGYNIFNPALVARAFIFFAYPSEMSGDAVWSLADELTAATPLAVASSMPGLEGPQLVREAGYTLQQMFVGLIPGSVGGTSKVAILLGAVVLLVTRIANWRIMAGGLAGMTIAALLANWMAPSFDNPALWLSPLHHLLMGGFAFGLVFMATDPVSASQTDSGRWIYGALIGTLAVMIRVLNQAFVEGVMLAILLGNAFAPMIDYFVLRQNIAKRQRAYAQQ